mmetsp:Transcript_3073/g.8915  ORF Transcript_3073/g.8915 Transcript_3073/m.8915 type:complete len:242 (+) Transcript_3073:1712-2437(+)
MAIDWIAATALGDTGVSHRARSPNMAMQHPRRGSRPVNKRFSIERIKSVRHETRFQPARSIASTTRIMLPICSRGASKFESLLQRSSTNNVARHCASPGAACSKTLNTLEPSDKSRSSPSRIRSQVSTTTSAGPPRFIAANSARRGHRASGQSSGTTDSTAAVRERLTAARRDLWPRFAKSRRARCKYSVPSGSREYKSSGRGKAWVRSGTKMASAISSSARSAMVASTSRTRGRTFRLQS